MSDRTQSSVRTGARAGDADAASGSASGGTPPVTSTQNIPGANTPRTQAAAGATDSGPVPPSVGGTPDVTGPAGSPSAASGTAAGARQATARGRGRGPAKAGGRGPRRARLQLRHVDIWSAFKISLVLSIALFFIWMVAIGVLYGVLNGLGVFDTLNDLFGQLGTASGAEVGGDLITAGVVFSGAAVIGAINIVLMTALCTVGTFIYNLCADLVGGLELTLSERD
jgi:hypothetical protein